MGDLSGGEVLAEEKTPRLVGQRDALAWKKETTFLIGWSYIVFVLSLAENIVYALPLAENVVYVLSLAEKV
jgi:hypothetical protein